MVFSLRSQRLSLKSPQAQAAAWSVMARIMSTAIGFLSVVLVGLCLDGATQGYFYAILALTAFLPLADFGVSYAAMQSASHEASALQWTSSGLAGEAASLQRIGALLRISRRVNAVVTLGASALLGVIGLRVLLANGSSPPNLRWVWLGVLACTSMTQLIAPHIAVLEGAGRVREVWRLRLVQEVVGGALLAVSLVAGLGVYSLLANGLGRLLCAVRWLVRRDLTLPRAVSREHDEAWSHWLATVWPFQWRIGISAVSGFFLSYLFTPVLLVTHGPIIAGQFGMTLAVAYGIQNITTAWLNSQAPHFGALIALGDYSALDSTFARTFRRSTLVALAGTVSAVAALAILTQELPRFADRLLPLSPFTLLMMSVLVNHVVFALATYLRAHRRDPFVFVSAAGAVLMAVAVPWAAHTGTATRVAGSYLALNLLGLCLAYVIFISCRRRWHAVGGFTMAVS